MGPNGAPQRVHKSSIHHSQTQLQNAYSSRNANPVAALYGDLHSASVRSSFATPNSEKLLQLPQSSTQAQVPAFVRSSSSSASAIGANFSSFSSIAEPSGSRPPLFEHYVSNLRYVPATTALIEPQYWLSGGANSGDDSPLPSALFSDTLAAATLSQVLASDRSPNSSPKRTSPKRSSPKRAPLPAAASAPIQQSHSRDESDLEDEFELQGLAPLAPPRLPARPLLSREPLSRKRPNDNAHDEDSTDSEPELAEAAGVALAAREFRSSNPVARTLSRADDRVCHN